MVATKGLAKLFSAAEVSSPLERQRRAGLCGSVGIALNCALCLAKLGAGAASGSLAIATDGLNNLADAGTALAQVLGFRLASVGAGERHPFGHGRYEWLMGLMSGTLVLAMGVALARESVLSIADPAAASFSGATFAVLAASVAVKLAMCAYNSASARATGSVALRATAADCLGDAAATSAVGVSSLVQCLTGLHVDGWCSLGISAFIVVSSIGPITESAERLIGQAPPAHVLDAIRGIALAQPGIGEVREVAAHDYGMGRYSVSMHVSPSPGCPREQADRAAADIYYELSRELGCDATVQIDWPARGGTGEGEIRRAVERALGRIGACRVESLHVSDAPGCRTVLVRVSGDDSLRCREEELAPAVDSALSRIGDGREYRAVIKLEVSPRRGRAGRGGGPRREANQKGEDGNDE